MTKTTCLQCSAPLNGLVCEYCGSLANLHMNQDEEMQALTEYHNILLKLEEKPEAEIKILSNGFIPSNPDVLIEAGVRMIPIIDLTNTYDDVVEAASRRLDAISLRLRLLPDTPEITRALKEFETFTEEFNVLHKKQSKETNILIALLLVFIIAACLFFGFLLIG